LINCLERVAIIVVPRSRYFIQICLQVFHRDSRTNPSSSSTAYNSGATPLSAQCWWASFEHPCQNLTVESLTLNREREVSWSSYVEDIGVRLYRPRQYSKYG
jgi:hypothetical protein